MERDPFNVRLEALEAALKQAIDWLRQTEDGSDTAIANIYGRETLWMLTNWEALIALGVSDEQERKSTVSP